MTKSIIVLFTVALLTTQAHAIGGSIAVGLNTANKVDMVQVSFAADATIETDEVSLSERIYYVPGKVRDETMMSGMETVFIQRYDLGKSWMLMPQNVYMETDVENPSEQIAQYRLIERENMGRETVNGMETTKYKVIYETNDGKFGGFTWFTDDFIAVQSFLVSEEKGEKTRIRFEITNLERGPQDSNLFELPAGATRMDLSLAGPQLPGFGTGGFAEGIGDAAKQGAKEGAEQATRQTVRDQITKGFRKFFKR